MITFDAYVLKVEVRKLIVKHEKTRETPAYYEPIRVGKLTLEFDADTVDVDELAHLIHETPAAVRIANTQGPERAG
jgi:hypothetical protein